MRTMKRSLIILLALALLLAACSPATALEQNRQKWAGQEISHYRFNLMIGCFCAFRSQMPLTVEVQNGKIVSIETADGSPIVEGSRQIFEQAGMMEKLFAVIEEAQANGADELAVVYDPTYGFPSQISINPIKNATDDEISYYVENFQVL
jgi:hypothetical protein